MECPLCEIDAGVVAQTALWTVVLNKDQAFLGRCYFALKRHETDVTQLTQVERDTLWECFVAVKGAIDTLFEPDHYNYVFLMNVTAHLHAHIIPRYAQLREFAGETFHDGRVGYHYDATAGHFLVKKTYDDLVETIKSAVRSTGGLAQ